ncbi:transcriptional repressor [Christensenellaceae bacterium]|nr:transcriptional repressor [Christensenellaceae bacterium]BDF60224.1 transcriptional repressor [Christensenellaceae bacterium]
MVYSKQRELILKTVLERRIHPTADTVFSLLKPDHPNLSLATVYRNLNLLAENGLLLRIPVPDGADHFDGTLSPHYHMICEKCGQMVDVPREYVPAFDSEVAQKTGCVIHSHTIVFYGLCEHCNRASQASS